MSPLQLLILVQLDNTPKYGYEMLKAINEEFTGIWDLKTGTLYPALRSMEKQGLVETQERGGVDFYHITVAGRECLHQLAYPQQNILRFSIRFSDAMAKWMSPEFKKRILANLINIPKEDINLNQTVFNFLSNDVPEEAKLAALLNLRANMQQRLTIVAEMISNLEEKKD